MKRLKKLGFYLFFILFAGMSNLQGQINFAGHVHAVTFLGDLNQYYKGGYGISGQAEYNLNDKIIGVGRAGFLFIPNNLAIKVLVFAIPIQLGAKYMINDKFYAQGMIGIYQINAVTTFGSGSGANFSLGAGVGVQLGKIDIAPHLDFVANKWTNAGIRIGYRIER